MGESEQNVALVTGGSRGIGKSIALRLAADGAFVVVNYSKNESSASDVVSEKGGGRAEISGFDVSDFDAVQNNMDYIIERHGGIHILVNNAGVTHDSLLLRMNKEDWDEVINTNLNGV